MSIAPMSGSQSTPEALQRFVKQRRHAWVALHSAVLQHLRQDPDRVFRIAARNIATIDENTRGHATSMMGDWRRLIDDQSIATIEKILTGQSEHDVEMRNLTPFAGVLDEAEHLEIREHVNRERAGER